MAYINYYIWCDPRSPGDGWIFWPTGETPDKGASLSINGCAGIWLLIAALEDQRGSFTVDEPDNKRRPPGRVTSRRSERETRLRCLFICWLRLGAAVKYRSVIPCRERDENKRCSTRLLSEKKKVNPHLLLLTERLSRGLFSWPGIWLFSKRIINSFVTVGVTLMLLRAH